MQGAELGPLHGIPVTIKENVDVKGTPTPNGMAALESVIAPDHAPLVQNLLNAGAIIVGRTNTPELSMRATTDNPLHGRTQESLGPRGEPGRLVGRRQRGRRGGLRPDPPWQRHRRLAALPVLRLRALHRQADQQPDPRLQPVADRRARHAGAADVGAGRHVPRGVRRAPGDPGHGRGRPARSLVGAGAVRRPAAAAADQGRLHERGARLSDPSRDRAAAGRAAGYLQDAGYAVEEVETPSIMEPAQEWFDVAVHEIHETLGPIVAAHGSETIRRIFDYFARIGSPIGREDYGARLAARTTLTRRWNVFLADHPLVLCPFMMRPLYPWDYDQRGFEQTRDLFASAIYSMGVNYLSLPAGVVPIGLIEGLPAGVQIIGARYREDLILDAMSAIEQRVGILVHQLWQREEVEA